MDRHILLCFVAFILLCVDSQLTIDTAIYPYSGTTPTVFFDQGKIYEIEWKISGCMAGVNAIKALKWNGGTGTDGCDDSAVGLTICTTVNLAADEYINAYRVEWEEQGLVAIWFRSNKGTEYKCGPTWTVTDDSGWIEHTNYYLSGFQYEAGWIIDRIGFQFTMYTTSAPTNFPSFSPSKYPTNNPSISPSKYPTKSGREAGAVKDEISTTHTYKNDTLGTGTKDIDMVFIIIVSLICLCFIIIALVIWREKSKNSNKESMKSLSAANEIGSVSSVTTDDCLSELTHNANRNVALKVISMVNTDYGQTSQGNDEGVAATNTKYNNAYGGGNELEDDNMVNTDNDNINSDGNDEIDDIVNEINKTDYGNENNLSNDEFEVEQVTHGNGNNLPNDEFEVVDDNMNALQSGNVNVTPGVNEITTA